MVCPQYLDLLQDVWLHGQKMPDRTGTGRYSVFGRQLRFDMKNGFPLVTTKETWFKGIVGELLWFLKGDTNIKYLNDNGIHFWDAWADEDGNLGPIYGKQIRNRSYYEKNNFTDFYKKHPSENSARNVDQYQNVIDSIKKDPDSRRHIITTWNPQDQDEMQLPPCHGLVIQFYPNTSGYDVENHCKRKDLSLHMYQRSADIFLGVPFNIASYALLLHIVAQECGYYPRELIISFGDVHYYENHADQVKEQLHRLPYELPTLANFSRKKARDYEISDFKLNNYQHHPAIKAEVAV